MTALPGAVNRESTQHHYGNRIRHVAPYLACRFTVGDSASRKGIVANDASRRAYDIGARCADFLIGERASLKPVMERRNPGIEPCSIVTRRKLFRGSYLITSTHLFPGWFRSHEAAQPWVVGRSFVERCGEPFEGLFIKLKVPLIQQDGFRLAAGHFQHEVRPILAQSLRRPINHRTLVAVGSEVYSDVAFRFGSDTRPLYPESQYNGV